jgi:hypothetical protein
MVPVLFEAKMNYRRKAVNENPYCSPVDVVPGRYEWPLWRRILYVSLMLASLYLACGAAASWKFYRDIGPRDTPIVERVRGFLTDWRSASEERHYKPATAR